MTAPISILVVDDEKGICQNVKKILAKGDFEITAATSGREALEIMADKPFELVISDVVMPEMNGLQFLKSLKAKWPETKTVMMTAYASTDTAMRAIRLGALDYLPKPFTPNELRAMVDQALAGKLIEAKVSTSEKETISVNDVNTTLAPDEAAVQTSEDDNSADISVKANENLEGFCEVGDMVCDIFKKLGATCKAGVKTKACPQKKAKKRKGKAAAAKKTDVRTLIGVDQPFNYDEVKAVTGPEYLNYLRHDGVVMPTYEELKANVAHLLVPDEAPVDVSVESSDPGEPTVAEAEAPQVEITADASVEGFCEVGDMVCDIFKKLGATCKAGLKTGGCPQKKAKKKKGGSKKADTRHLINPDLPFDYEEVAAATGPEYVEHLVYDGVVQVPYAQLKANYEALLKKDSEQPSADTKPTAKAEANTVLVIDDEMAVNNNIRKILSKKKYKVDQAATKEDALDKILATLYELVLLDLRIPGVKGLELLAAIREAQPDARVIIVTGYASIDTAKEAARMGAVDYLPKPFTPDEIRGATEKAMKIAA